MSMRGISRLASRGDKLTIVFPRSQCVRGMATSWIEPVKTWFWKAAIRGRNRPLVKWLVVHPWVRIAFVSDVKDRYMPDADIVIATAWTTASRVADLVSEKGVKFYLIQHHEV